MNEHLLKPADRVEITVIVDNYIDFFVVPPTPVDRRLLFDPARQILIPSCRNEYHHCETGRETITVCP